MAVGLDISVDLFSDAPDEPDTFFCTEQRDFSVEYERCFIQTGSPELDYTISMDDGSGNSTTSTAVMGTYPD